LYVVVGLITKQLLSARRDTALYNVSGQCCVGYDRSTDYITGSNYTYFYGGVSTLFSPSPWETTMLRVELDADAHIVYWFVNGSQIRHCVRGIPRSVFVAVSRRLFFFRRLFDFVSICSFLFICFVFISCTLSMKVHRSQFRPSRNCVHPQ
jgi:hypothetical protein